MMSLFCENILKLESGMILKCNYILKRKKKLSVDLFMSGGQVI